MTTSPDSAAQISIQAAEYIRRFGALVPFDVSPPLLPVLIAALSLSGLSERTAYGVVLLAAYGVGCAAVYWLVLRFQSSAVAAFAACLYALAPSRLPPASLATGSLLLCWSLVPALLVALDSVRRRPGPANIVVALAVAALVWASHMRGATAHDLVALGELAAVLAVSLLAGEAFRRAALVAFLVVGGWVWFLGPPAPEPIPTELLTRASSGMSNRTPFGAASIALEMNPIQSRVRDMILSPGRLDESLLWLRAMAAGVVLSDDGRKFDGALERLNEQAGWSLYGLPDPNPAPVVVVSRHQWMNLPPIRGLHDFEGLEQYIAWAGRPEAASFRPLGGGSIEVRGDLGPLDMFLIRRNCQPGWRAYRETPTRQELAIECDPLGFMAVDPGREGETVEGETVGGEPVGGETVLRLEFRPSWTQRLFPEGMAPRPLPGGDFPRITPGGVIEATRFHPPPFRPGALLSIFGQHFASASTQVLFGEIPGELVWAGPQQINVRLPESVSPGELNVVVESAGRRSFAEPIEVEQ